MADPDRRETLEAAFSKMEEEAAAPAPEVAAPAPEVAAPAPEVVAAPTVAATPAASPPAIAPAPKPGVVDVERPPQAWKEPMKAKWNTLDPEIRQEVLRRERETTSVLNETARARQFEQVFGQVVQPYMARINSLGANPINAVAELFKADHILSSAPPRERAQRMAKLISDYGIDIAELDSALSGKAADPVETRVETLLKSRLEPFNAYLQQQQQREQQERQLQEQTVAETVNRMAQDAKYPYFERVRSTMADLIEFAAAKGQTLTIDSAYNRAVVLDPDINQEITAQKTSQNAAALLADSTAKAKRALNASVSVSGSPTGSATGSPSPADRRATIEAAFSAAEGR